MKPHRNFDEDMNDAASWEKRVSEKIESFVMKYKMRRIPYDTSENIELQKKGIDVIVESEPARYEIKTRAHKYYRKGILLETTSVVERNKPGWLYTSEADCITYVWKNVANTNVEPIGYFLLLKELRKTQWYDRLPGSYHVFSVTSKRKTPQGMIYWTTEFIVPPIKDFPKYILWKFNAILPSNYKQTILPVGNGRE